MKKNKETGLNPQQEKFCQLYATETEFFGNGVESYTEVYKPDKSKPNWYKSVQSAASRLLSNVKICGRINELLTDGGLNDQFADKQLQFLLTQHSDFGTKLGAIREYNKLKQRITDKLDLTSKGEKIPIYAGQSIQKYNSNEENIRSLQEDSGGVRGDISQ